MTYNPGDQIVTVTTRLPSMCPNKQAQGKVLEWINDVESHYGETEFRRDIDRIFDSLEGLLLELPHD